MAVAALVVSIVALLVSGASVWYTRRQAIANEQTRRIEADRRHDELTPRLTGEHVRASRTREGLRPGVRLTNYGPLDLDRVEVETVPAHRSHEAVISGIYDPLTGGVASVHETGRMPVAQPWPLEVIPVPSRSGRGERGGSVVFRCRCYAAGHDPWTVTVEVLFPTSSGVLVKP